jgi:limonene-1,2-epoxide hydrolase
MPDPHDRIHQRIDDLTRALDESPAAEQEETIAAELERTVQAHDKEVGMSEAEKVVRQFCEAWSRKDIDELLGFFTEDAVYHNIPIDPAVGHEAIRNIMNIFVPMATEIIFEITNLATDGNTVLTERVDHFVMPDRSFGLPVMGTFEIRDGKIAAWRDYFDMAQFMGT